jgi:hypothetical protein
MIKADGRAIGLNSEWLAADTVYGTGKFLHWVIAPHIHVWDMSKREEGILSRLHWRRTALRGSDLSRSRGTADIDWPLAWIREDAVEIRR